MPSLSDEVDRGNEAKKSTMWKPEDPEEFGQLANVEVLKTGISCDDRQ